ncbi:MAG: VOC family protein [Nitrospinota bacterium]
MLENLHHASITVSDIDECLSLYRDILGMEVAMDMEFQGENVEKIMGRKGVRFRVLHLRHKDAVLELLQFYEPERTTGRAAARHPTDVGITHIAFTVKDVQGLTRTLEEKGYEFLTPPVRTPSGR